MGRSGESLADVNKVYGAWVSDHTINAGNNAFVVLQINLLIQIL